MLNPKTLRLIRAGSYAALATVTPTGALSCQMMWVGCDDEFLYVNTEVERYKFGNMRVGAPVALMIFESSRSWVEVRGTVIGHIHGDTARAHLDELSTSYNHRPYAKRIDSPRVICRIRPDREFVYLPSTSGVSEASASPAAQSSGGTGQGGDRSINRQVGQGGSIDRQGLGGSDGGVQDHSEEHGASA